jgi:hypothetical protein
MISANAAENMTIVMPEDEMIKGVISAGKIKKTVTKTSFSA